MRNYPGNPANLVTETPLLDDSDAWDETNLALAPMALTDRIARLEAAAFASGLGNFKTPIGLIVAAGPTASVRLQAAAWDGSLQRWTAVFGAAGSGTAGEWYVFATHSSGDLWAQLGATSFSVAYTDCLAGASNSNDTSVFCLVNATGGNTDTVAVDSFGNVVATTQTAVNKLSCAAMSFQGSPGAWVLFGFEQSGSVYKGHLLASTAATGVWADGTSSLPSNWQTGTNNVGATLIAFDPGGTASSTNPAVVAMCGRTPGTDSSRLLGLDNVAGTVTDITPAFMVSGLIVTGLVYNVGLSLWGVLCHDVAGAYLYTTPDQITWTKVHTFGPIAGLHTRAGNLQALGALWVAQLSIVESGSGSVADNDRVLFSIDGGVTWTSASYAMGGDATSGDLTTPQLLLSGNQLLAFNNQFHNFSHQAGVMAGGGF